MKRHWQGVTNPVTLRLPNKTEKRVFWEKTSRHDVWFCDGWKEFANYLSLGESQLLMFQYQDNSFFNVIIFGKCGLEIKYPSETTEEYEEVEKSDNSLKIIKDPSSRRGKRPKSPSPSSRVSMKMKNNPEEQKESKHEKRNVQAHARFRNIKDADNGWFYSIILCFFLFFLLSWFLFFKCLQLYICFFFWVNYSIS